MKACVTGSTGLVGSEAVKFFEDKGWEVIGIDNNGRSEFFGTPKKTPQYNIDIRDFLDIDILFAEQKFDAIIHCAAQPSHDYATDNVIEDFTVNALGTLNLLEATRKHCPDAVFVHVSTDKVYGMNIGCKWHGDKLWNETVPLDKTERSLFGVSKLAADLYVQEYGYKFGIKTACFRCGCITGRAHEGTEQHGFLAYLVKCIKEGKTYKIFGFDGEQVRDQIHASDLANAFYEFIQDPKLASVYNMGGGPDRARTLKEFAQIISDKLGKPFISEYVDKVRKADRIYDVHDVSYFKSHYPKWEYEYSLDDIITDICE